LLQSRIAKPPRPTLGQKHETCDLLWRSDQAHEAGERGELEPYEALLQVVAPGRRLLELGLAATED
jgi:hypothetical protein